MDNHASHPTLDLDQAQAAGIRLAGVFLGRLGDEVKNEVHKEKQFREKANQLINHEASLTKIVIDAFMDFMTTDQLSVGLSTREATLELVVGQIFRVERVHKTLFDDLGGVWMGKRPSYLEQPLRGVVSEITQHALAVLGCDVQNTPAPKSKTKGP